MYLKYQVFSLFLALNNIQNNKIHQHVDAVNNKSSNYVHKILN